MSTPSEFDRALHEELERRVREISAYPEDTFGLISTTELCLCALASVALPLVLVWWTR